MIDSFRYEFEKNCTPCGHHWKHGDNSGNHFKHGETLLKVRFIEPCEFRVQNIISFDGVGANRTVVFLCKLADKYGITITGRVQPNLVGPSITGKDVFHRGMSLDKLLRWYSYYGFESEEREGVIQVKRGPKNES